MITKQDAEYIFKNLAYKTKTYDEMAEEFLVHKTTLCKWMKQFKPDFGLDTKEKYSAFTYLRFKYSEDIIEKYQNGESTAAIANFYGFSDDHMIANLLRELNVEIRPVGYTSKTNQKLFSLIENEIQAYTLGLIAADGSVNSHYSINIDLAIKDRAILDEINSRLYNNTGSFLTYSKKNTTTTMIRLAINGKSICQNLAQYGIIPCKTYSLKTLPKISEELMPAFLRGLFDGDGVCAKNLQYLRVGFCGYNKEFIEEIQNYFVSKCNMKKNQLFNTGNCWDCSWGSRNDIQNFYNFLYQNATIFLSRKHDKIQSYLYDNTEVIN